MSRIVYKKVSVDCANVALQVGHDVFAGKGWKKFDREVLSDQLDVPLVGT